MCRRSACIVVNDDARPEDEDDSIHRRSGDDRPRRSLRRVGERRHPTNVDVKCVCGTVLGGSRG